MTGVGELRQFKADTTTGCCDDNTVNPFLLTVRLRLLVDNVTVMFRNKPRPPLLK